MKKITASIITIGDELLIGQVTDTNSAWIAQQINNIGVWVHHRTAVGDDAAAIKNALDEEGKRSDIILITGGLGPTADDITKPVLCEYFGGKLVMHEPTLEHVTYLFRFVFKRPMPLLDRNRKQAEVPDTCTVLKNERGTAPGMMFEKDGKIFISMPGVPYEMQGIVEDHVLSIIKSRFQMPYIGHKTLLTAGLGESMLAEQITDLEEALPGYIKLAYLPNYGMVRLRLTGIGEKNVIEKDLDAHFNAIKERLKEYVIAEEDKTLQEITGGLLKKTHATVSTAESCTGGYIAHLLTSVSGSAAYFMGTVVSYDNAIKQKVLGVQESTLVSVGAVSEETVKEMLTGVLQLMGTDYAIAVSGIMGPEGGTPDKPVGTVWVAVGNSKSMETKKFQFRTDRKKNIELTAINALNLLRAFIVKNSIS